MIGPNAARAVIMGGGSAQLQAPYLVTPLAAIEAALGDRALRGRKVGERMVRQAVEDARRDGVAVIPLCPFAKAQIDRHPEWQDVLKR